MTYKRCLQGLPGGFIAFALLAAPAHATPVSSAGTITYWQVTAAPGAPGNPELMPGTNLLKTAGSGYPDISNRAGPNQTTTVNQPPGFFQPQPPLALAANPNLIGGAPHAFASADIKISAVNAGPSPAFYVNANPLFAKSSAASSDTAVEDWSVDVAVKNDLPQAVVGYIVAGLNFLIEVPADGSGYATLSLDVTATVGNQVFSLPYIVIAADGQAGANADFIGSFDPFTNSAISTTGLLFNGLDPVTHMERWAGRMSVASAPIVLSPGQQWEVKGAFTCAVEGGAQCINRSAKLINWIVPEPASLWLAFGALLAAAGLRLRIRRNRGTP